MRRLMALLLIIGTVIAGGCSGSDETPNAAKPTTAAASAPSCPHEPEATDEAVVALSERECGRLELDSPDWLATASGALWVKLDGGDVVRVDPDTGTVAAQVPPPGARTGPCQGFGAIDEAVYACPYPGLIERIDPNTNQIVEEIEIRVLGDQGHLPTAGGRIWVITGTAEAIRGIDPGDNEVGPPIELGAFCTQLAASGPLVWAVCPSDGLLLRVDTTSGEVTGRLRLPGAMHVAAGDSVWVAFDKGIAQVDPDTLKVEFRYDLSIGLGGSIYVDTDRVLLRADGGPFLTVIDPGAHKVVQTIEAPDLPSGGNVIRVGDSIWATAYDDGTVVRLQL